MKKLKAGLKWLVYHILRVVLFTLIRIFFRPKLVYASEKARQEAFREPMVIISNHVRGMDGAVMYCLFSREPMVALSAKDMMEGKHRLLGVFLSFLPVIPIDRQNASLSWLRESRKALKAGKHVMIFPEGKCQFDRVTKPFKPGCVLLAASAGVKVLPIYHNGTYHYLFGRRFRMIVGEPVTVTPPPEGLTQEELERGSERLFLTLNDLERQLTGEVRRLPDA